MRSTHTTMLIVTATVFPAAVASANWVTFVNETASRLIASPALGATDPEEKDYAVGDLNANGWVDVVVVRKQPFTVSTGKRNVLFMNESGALVDRTAEYATDADDGGQGFLDITNDRDVAIGDVNLDGWLDVVTAPALNNDLPKTISHPRVYINKGTDGGGNWLGLRYEEPRIPAMPQAPNACGVAVGDVSNDGWPDIYIVNYNSSQGDRLLINTGQGFYADQTSTRLSAAAIASGFGTTAHIRDINGDGFPDLVKSENGPVKGTYNNPGAPGFFINHHTISSGAHYNLAIGDLNNDGKLDLVIGDDGADRYALNTGNNGQAQALFTSFNFSFQSGGDDGFPGNAHVADLNNDGWNDALICDVDVDIPGCNRRLNIYRNLGNAPNVTLQDQGTGGIPTNMLTGSHDVAILDLNNDGWLDLVIGRCAGTQIWMNLPPISLDFNYPQGRPNMVTPDLSTDVQIELAVTGDTTVVVGSPTLHTIIGGVSTQSPLVQLGGNLYVATLPAVSCLSSIDWYVSAQLTGGGTYVDPVGAPGNSYTVLAIGGVELESSEGFESGDAGWTVENTGPVAFGTWVRAQPVGTISGGNIAAPFDQTTPSGAWAFLTGVGNPGGNASLADLDGGPTVLTSATFDLEGTDAMISYSRWFFCSNLVNPTQADKLVVQISNDNGGSWTTVEEVAVNAGVWVTHSFLAGDFVAPTSTMQVRFVADDTPNNSITEAGIDDFTIEKVVCGGDKPCPGDLNGDGFVDGADLGLLLNGWGGKGSADLNNDGTVDGADLGLMLNSWGSCK